MAWELSRRRFVRTLSSTLIFGRIPLINLLVFLVEMALLGRLIAGYQAFYDRRPLVTMMVTNAILHGIADTVAQTLSTTRARSRLSGTAKPDPPLSRSSLHTPQSDDIPLPPYPRKGSPALISEKDVVGAALNIDPAAAQYSPERTARFVAYGFCMAPVQFRWFGLLGRLFPLDKAQGALTQALKRVAFDQLVFAPVGLGLFFTVMTIAEGGGKRAIAAKFRDLYVPSLKANYMVWPTVQMINFRLMPVQYQLPFVSTVGIAWTAYLSLANASEDAEPSLPRVRQA